MVKLNLINKGLTEFTITDEHVNVTSLVLTGNKFKSIKDINGLEKLVNLSLLFLDCNLLT